MNCKKTGRQARFFLPGFSVFGFSRLAAINNKHS